MLASFLLAVHTLTATATGQVDVSASARTEARGRHVLGPLPDAAVSEVEARLVAALSGRLRIREWSAQLDYAPSVQLRDVFARAYAEPTHSGLLRLAFAPDARALYRVE